MPSECPSLAYIWRLPPLEFSTQQQVAHHAAALPTQHARHAWAIENTLSNRGCTRDFPDG